MRLSPTKLFGQSLMFLGMRGYGTAEYQRIRKSLTALAVLVANQKSTKPVPVDTSWA